jgi:hypothetical protein
VFFTRFVILFLIFVSSEFVLFSFPMFNFFLLCFRVLKRRLVLWPHLHLLLASFGGGADPSSATVSSAAPSAQAAPPHEGRTTDITSGALEV